MRILVRETWGPPPTIKLDKRDNHEQENVRFAVAGSSLDPREVPVPILV